ncbi:MAG: hypothetical protein NTX50_03830 [Candidatus Sumerlaeota bacterium]|nr:hypothetical protein [Candidatus Sumerlaeota bacterium]
MAQEQAQFKSKAITQASREARRDLERLRKIFFEAARAGTQKISHSCQKTKANRNV